MATLLFSSNVFPLLSVIIGVAFGFSNEFIYWCLIIMFSMDTLCVFLTGLSDCSKRVNNALDKLDDWCLAKFF